MGFDASKFMQTKFNPRTEKIPLPDMADFFEDGEKPEIEIKGLSGHELAECNAAVERNRNLKAVLEGVAAARDTGIKDAISNMLGYDRTPDDAVKRISMLALGTTDNSIDESVAVKICTVYPIEFYQLTNAISKLTGQGYQPGK